MNIIATAIPEVVILEAKIFEDDRGFFYESFNEKAFFEATGSTAHFVQDNHSKSSRGVLRGMHYQVQQPQGKLVRVTKGRVFNVAVDIRRSSPTFQQWVGIELSETNRRQVWIPMGFAHGFLVLSDIAECQYKTDTYYAPEHERCISWDDSSLNIQWPIEELQSVPIRLSPKDRQGKMVAASELFD